MNQTPPIPLHALGAMLAITCYEERGMIFLARYLAPDSAMDLLLNQTSPILLHSLGAVQLFIKKDG